MAACYAALTWSPCRGLRDTLMCQPHLDLGNFESEKALQLSGQSDPSDSGIDPPSSL
jgi:hypothetical protein